MFGLILTLLHKVSPPSLFLWSSV